MEQVVQAPNIGIFVNLVTYALACGTFLIALAMIRGFIVRGISLSIAVKGRRKKSMDNYSVTIEDPMQ